MDVLVKTDFRKITLAVKVVVANPRTTKKELLNHHHPHANQDTSLCAVLTVEETFRHACECTFREEVAVAQGGADHTTKVVLDTFGMSGTPQGKVRFADE